MIEVFASFLFIMKDDGAMRVLFALKQWKVSFLLLGVLFLAGCGMSRASSDLPSAPQNVVPMAPLSTGLMDYRIQVGDTLEIKLLLNPELEEQVIVRPDGKISTSVAQNVLAYGLTPPELQKILNERYKAHLTDPNVSVVVRTFAPTRIYVLGEVYSPGEYISVGPGLTLLQALARAGGVKPSAKTRKIVVLRRGGGDHPAAFVADYDDAVSGRNPGADVRLAAYDVIYVPRLAVAEAFLNYQQFFQQFITPSVNMDVGRFNYGLN